MINSILTLCLLLLSIVYGQAQPALDIIKANCNFAASNYSIYPDTALPVLTPAPKGKVPFYISHYGRHGSRYIENRKGFDIPFKMLCKADSVNELTPTGKKALSVMRVIFDDTEKHWGDLTSFGQRQHRGIAKRMMENFPEVFEGSAIVDARSTIVPRCILSMGAALNVMAIANPELRISMRASQEDMWYMNHQDPVLRKNGMAGNSRHCYDEYTSSRKHNDRLMDVLFVHPDSVRGVISDVWLNYYLIKMGLFQMNTHLYEETYLTDIFSYKEIYRLWQWENVWWYLMHGACKLNGGHQPYSQRYLLRKIITDADSHFKMERPGVQLRFGHETVLLPLTCLIGINGFDFETNNLEEVEKNGWWASKVFPMGSNLQFIFYRRDIQDEDVLFKVLLNEREATLPIPTDVAPYYHWKDFREHYLKKLDAYEQLRNATDAGAK
ncbi:MAG: histidine-type phosphatase [Prevotella sp.]|nr:histidine-type phosphatase [Prevotella sp.]